MNSLITKIKRTLSSLYEYMQQHDIKLNVNRELPYLTILSLLYASAKIPVYKLLSDDLLNIFSGLKYVKNVFTKSLSLNLSLEALMTIISNVLKSKVLAKFLTSYELLTRIDPTSIDFIERYMEETLQIIEDRWKKYNENTLVFVELVIAITTFLIILTIAFSLLSTISGTSYTSITLILAPILTLTTLISIIILDSICPIKAISYNGLLALSFYVLVSLLMISTMNSQLGIILLLPLLIILLLLTLSNMRYFIKQIPNVLSSLELIVDQIFAYLRLGVPVTIALDNILKNNIINSDVKQLLIAIKTSKITQSISRLLKDVRVSALISLILGAFKVGYIDYDKVLRVKKLLNNVFILEKTFKKQTMFISIMTIILPSIMLILLYFFVLNVLSVTSLASTSILTLGSYQYQNIVQIDYKILNLLRDLTASMIIVALSLNTIISKAVDYTITSVWRTSISIMLVLITFIVLLLLI